MKKRNEIVVEKLKEVVTILNEIDSMIESQSVELQNVDLRLSDLYHLIENNELSKEASAKVVSEIHDLRLMRRYLHNEHEIENTYNVHKSKLTGKDTRQFLMAEVHKTVKALDTEYKNRILTDEEVNEIINLTDRMRGRPPTHKDMDDVVNE